MKDPLGDRMKNNYETVSKTRLVRRMPVIIRVDGKAFHTFTRGFKKPFDMRVFEAMMDTMRYMADEMQNCVLAYMQSDEISFLLKDYNKLDTCAWLDNEVQKMVSVAASMATAKFNSVMSEMNIEKTALFDARAFNIPKEEVANYFLWRQRDAKRNATSAYARQKFGAKQIEGKTSAELLREMGAESISKFLDNKNMDIGYGVGYTYLPHQDEDDNGGCIEFSLPEAREHINSLLMPEE